MVIATSSSALRSTFHSLSHDFLFWTLLLVLIGLSVTTPSQIPLYLTLVDWPTMATLSGLLMLTKGVELSGFLHRLGAHLIARVKTERGLALFLVIATASLATLLTNDVALFVMVPLTLGMHRQAGVDAKSLPVIRLIVFEALAANAGSTLTPIGNPQNLYLWQQSRVSFATFTGTMLLPALLMLAALILLTVLAFSNRANAPLERSDNTSVNRKMLLTCLILYLPFLLMTDLHYAPQALGVVFIIFMMFYRRVLAHVDWALLLVFMLMFIDLRLIAAAEPVQALLASLDLSLAPRLYLAAIATSQFISNVPATILLAQYTHDWRVLGYGVNIGGAGLAIGSLANIIALRMAPEKKAWWIFHAYSVPFLLITGGLMYAWLTLR